MRKRSLASRAFVLLGMVIIVSFGPMALPGGLDSAEGQPSTMVVAQDGSGDYLTISDALASVTDGFTIEVRPGTYNENIVVDKRVDLIGAGNDTTFIRGNGTVDVVSIESDKTTFAGFHVSGSGDDRAGIATRADQVTIRNTTCTNNTIGIFINGTRVSVQDNNCSDNSGIGIKVHIPIRNPWTAIYRNSCVRNKNYGIFVLETDNVTAGGNTCSRSVYGIFYQGSDFISISWNRCDSNVDHGIYISGGEGKTLDNNVCTNNGDGIELRFTSIWDVWMNRCEKNGKGIHVLQSSSTSLAMNDCIRNGDGIFLETSEQIRLLLNNCSDNSASGIHLAEDASHNTIEHNSLYNNTERGIYLRSSSSHNMFDNNTIHGSKYGIRAVQYSENNTAKCNNIFGNSLAGIHVGDNSEAVNASHTWWGTTSGPFHQTMNPNGTGNNVTDFVSFLPWATVRINQAPTGKITEPDHMVTIQTEGDEIRFDGQGNDPGEVVRYRWVSSIDGEIHNDTSANFTTSKLTPGNHTISLYVQDDCGLWSEPDTIWIIVEEKDDDDEFFLSTPAGLLLIGIMFLVLAGGYYMMNQPPGTHAKEMGPKMENDGPQPDSAREREITKEGFQKDAPWQGKGVEAPLRSDTEVGLSDKPDMK
jgi:parallel beta-helix repeat protein